ncbi:nucleotide exchange factor GrpE [Azospira restricta]|uniref:Protein GrpE n=1 Tax=Azospira restricta TaxID=404405 RepID=A0A974PXG9_9RHOO|nr:nucleotide exchange factor GrpE [Azospira restricta]QRJ63257.1 nucleotide exchange factor GrpE [Azospira restricta]
MQEPTTPQDPLLPDADTPETAQEVAPAAAAAADSTPSLEELLRQAELRAEEHHDAWLRAKAETENTRRRAQEDIAKAHKFAVEKFAGDLLAVKDTLEMALADPNPDSLRAGVEMTLKNLVAAFDKAAIVELNPVGEKFDPHKHQAMAMIDAEQPANTVVQVFQKGYLIAERTLRPAMVAVAKAKDS